MWMAYQSGKSLNTAMVLKQQGSGSAKSGEFRKKTSDPLIRLADAAAGFLLDAKKRDNQEMNKLLREAMERKTLVEV